MATHTNTYWLAASPRECRLVKLSQAPPTDDDGDVLLVLLIGPPIMSDSVA